MSVGITARSCPFDAIPAILQKPVDRPLRVTQPPTGRANTTLTIEQDCQLIFSPDTEFKLKRITISHCCVSIEGLNLFSGHVSVLSGGTLHIRDSRIYDTESEAAYQLSIDQVSLCTAENCLFSSPTRNSICVEHDSELRFTRCTVSSIPGFSLAINSRSTFRGEDATFSDCRSDCFVVGAECRLFLTRCVISECANRGIQASCAGAIELKECRIDGCRYESITALSCPEIRCDNCEFRRSGQTSLFCDSSSISVVSSQIISSVGNCINASRWSKLFARDCIIRDTTFPAIAVCDNSEADVERCFMRNTQLNGIVVRNMSKARFRTCWLENCGQHGIVVSESRDVKMSRIFVRDVSFALLSVYNHSAVSVTDCFCLGPSDVGIDVFTGGQLDCVRTIVMGARNHLIAVHHGGSARIVKPVLHAEVIVGRCAQPLERLRLIDWLTVRPTVGWDRVIRSETTREVVCLGGFLVGEGPFNMSMNEGSVPELLGRPCRPPICTICKSSARDSCFSPCGHSLFCQRCWDRLPEKPRQCALCMVAVEALIIARDCSWKGAIATCPICAETTANVVVVPCGHTICFDCSLVWFAQHQTCPYCGVKSSRSRVVVEHS
jgi:hypothetical protein